MKTILVPTDFSANADKAMKFAIDVAKKLNAKIILVNSYDLPYSANVMTSSIMDLLKETSEKGLIKASNYIETHDVEHSSKSQMGNPIRVIKECAKNYNADLIIMGTKGASGIEEVLLGSNTASVLHTVSCPVLAIPSEAQFIDINKIVYAADFEMKSDEKALKNLATLAKVFGAEVKIAHVQDDDHKGTPHAKFDEALGNIPHTFHILPQQEVEKAIDAFADAENADMVAVLTRKHSFFEGLFHKSVTSKIAYHSTIPVLALHEA